MRQTVLTFLRGGDSALPGYRLSLVATLLWTGFFIVLPLCALAIRPWQDGMGAVVGALHDTRMFAALWTSFPLRPWRRCSTFRLDYCWLGHWFGEICRGVELLMLWSICHWRSLRLYLVLRWLLFTVRKVGLAPL